MNNNNFFPIERNRYFYGKMLTARDFETEQRYFNNKRRLINRTLFGAGVVCGLGVYQNDDASFSVETGMALDYSGREIVVSEPVIRKLNMVEGYESLEKSGQGYLCLQYLQTDREPVNNIGASDHDSEQFNKIGEGYRLYLSAEEPLLSDIYGVGGTNSVASVYSSHGLRIVRIVPVAAAAEEEITLRFIVIKSIDSPPVSFTYRFESDYFRSSGESIELSFAEDGRADKDVFTVDFTLRTAMVSEVSVPLSSGWSELFVSIGDYTDMTHVDMPDIYICGSRDSLNEMRDTRISTLGNHIGGENTPLYLAKIDCLKIGTGYIIRHITPLPFGQRIHTGGSGTVGTGAASPSQSGAAAENFLGGGVSAGIETLEHWQQPRVNTHYDPKRGKLDFRFGIPSGEKYDYAASSGTVDIPISGAIRVNARFLSQDIPHGLGPGEVSLTLSVEYSEEGSRRLLFGSGEVFSPKNETKLVPRIESAALLDPDKGTFRVGLRLTDYVEGHTVRVRWFAFKPVGDNSCGSAEEDIAVQIAPLIHKMKPLERVRFTAVVEGTEDKTVSWSVVDADGGSIDDNGLYQAPSAAGTYEISACSNADPTSRVSAFVVVGEDT